MLLITQNARLIKKLQNVIWMILLLQISLICGQELNRPLRVVIDPGHGGMDSGAIGIDGIKEKDVVLNLALAIQNLNTRFQHPLDLYLTRSSDTLISLLDRSKLAKALDADLFMSLHCNHSDNPKARGVEVYVYEKQNSNTDAATWLAYQLQERFNKGLGFKSRGVRFADFHVLRESSNEIPAVLVEMGFLSNFKEAVYFRKHSNITNVSLSILLAIK